MKVKFRKWDCQVVARKYAVSIGQKPRIALVLDDVFDVSPIATATVNLPDIELGHDEVFIKDYSENEGMADSLIKAGVIYPEKVITVKRGYVDISAYKLTEEAIKTLIINP